MQLIEAWTEIRNQNITKKKEKKIMGDKEKYIVAARVGTNFEDCIVAPADAMIIATHRKVYGPDTKEKCERWKNRNCK
jgi:hypothetical protein